MFHFLDLLIVFPGVLDSEFLLYNFPILFNEMQPFHSNKKQYVSCVTS
jgi:hypothetical protein